MSLFEIILWVLGGLSALLALGKIMHEKECKDKNVCAYCGQSLPKPKESVDV